MESLKEQLVRQKYWQVWEQAQSDPAYAKLLAEMAVLEPVYESVMERLAYDDEDIIRDYVNQCEAMSQRMLEVACEKLLFGD